MAEPLFPMSPQRRDMPDAVLVIEPYRHEGAWVFDDPAMGLVREPFVLGVTEMIDRLATSIPDAAHGFRLLFAAHPFAECKTSLTWLRSDPVEGNWYRSDDTGDEGWLCPALFCYFPAAPQKIYLRAEPGPTKQYT
jgi:hypothetical protein